MTQTIVLAIIFDNIARCVIFIYKYLYLPLTFLRWAILDQLASYTNEGQLIISDVTDKQMSRLVNVTLSYAKSWRWLFNVMAEHVG